MAEQTEAKQTGSCTAGSEENERADALQRLRLLHVPDVSEAELEQALWHVIVLHQNLPFETARGLEFSYQVRGNELFVSRKEKSITRSSIQLALQKAVEQNGIVTGPKKLGTFGASYLYPLFLAFGIIRKTP